MNMLNKMRDAREIPHVMSSEKSWYMPGLCRVVMGGGGFTEERVPPSGWW